MCQTLSDAVHAAVALLVALEIAAVQAYSIQKCLQQSEISRIYASIVVLCP